MMMKYLLLSRRHISNVVVHRPHPDDADGLMRYH